MGDAAQPIFDGIGSKDAAQIFWDSNLRTATSLEMNGWDVLEPVLEFPEGVILEEFLEEAAEFILAALAALVGLPLETLKTKCELCPSRMLEQKPHFAYIFGRQ